MRNLRATLTRSLLATTVAAVGVALTPATAGADPITFIVNEAAVPGATPIVLGVTPGTTAPNNITAKYTETLTLSGSNFTANLLVTFTDYALNGLPVPNQVGSNTPGDEAITPSDYGLYALVTVSGTYTTFAHPTDAGITVFDFDPLASTANVFVNPDQAPGADLLVMTASLINPLLSDGTVDVFNSTGTVRDGDFSIVYTNAQTVGFGTTYWPTFTGLVLRATSSGDVDPTSTIVGASGNITGDASLSFEQQAVPEPASLTLLGMSLLGAGFAARRRRQTR